MQPNHNPEMYRRRRRNLMDFMRSGGERSDSGVAILPTAREQTRNGDVLYPFRPDSDFYYLTQFAEPDAVAVLIPDRAEGEFVLFCRENDPQQEIWDGPRQGLAGARVNYHADQSFPITELGQRLPHLIKNHHRLFTPMGRYPEFDKDLQHWVNATRARTRAGIHAPGEFVDIGHILHEMRLIKKPDEQNLMRRAAKLSAAAHRRALRSAAPGSYEYQVQAELECEFRLGGSASPAYPSIVAGGKNACVLHYIENNCQLQDGDLLLIDAGAELDCYAADITRTFPVNGKFSPAQRAIYEIVLAAQQAAIAEVVAGRSVTDYHNAAARVLTEGLRELKLLRGEVNELLETGAHKKFTLHQTGHWLGMDVHDVGDYKVDGEWRVLESGMVLTVEPGLYIRPSADIDPKWHNIGIRIEDDILITRAGNENLSADAPKQIAEIEAYMAEHNPHAHSAAKSFPQSPAAA